MSIRRRSSFWARFEVRKAGFSVKCPSNQIVVLGLTGTIGARFYGDRAAARTLMTSSNNLPVEDSIRNVHNHIVFDHRPLSLYMPRRQPGLQPLPAPWRQVPGF